MVKNNIDKNKLEDMVLSILNTLANTDDFEYCTQVWNITDHPNMQIYYKEKLVFRKSGKKMYYKPGEWGAQFKMLYSKACEIQKNWDFAFSSLPEHFYHYGDWDLSG